MTSSKFLLVLGILLIPDLDARQMENITRPAVGRTKEMVLAVDFSASVKTSPNSDKYALVSPSGGRVYCKEVVAVNKRMRLIFQINSSNFVVFENLVDDSSGFFIINEEPIILENDSILTGELATLTENQINTIRESDWKKYVLDEYAAQYLFPHNFGFGTNIGTADSTSSVYFLELVQSGAWVNEPNVSIFWGLKGRWSTERGDKLNFTQLYPLTILFTGPLFKASILTGVESGYLGFAKQGRGIVKGEVRFRAPINPIDITLGSPRWRVNPVVSVSGQWNTGWAEVNVPDSLKNSFDGNVEVKYDIPVGKSYYLQTLARGNYSTITKELLYQYELSLGYIANGEIRIAAKYMQGFQEVSYQFDKKLMLAFAFDILNRSTAE